MNRHRIVLFLGVLCLFALLTGCATHRWEIQNTQMYYVRSDLPPGREVDTKHSVLLDTKTGETWMLWTDSEETRETSGPSNYIWKRIPVSQ